MDFFHRMCLVFFFSLGLTPSCTKAIQTDWWPNGVIPYVLDVKFPQDIKSSLISAMREVEKSVNSAGSKMCIQFVEKTNELNALDIRHTLGCHTSVGYSATRQNFMSVGRGCESRGILLHEFHHVLGFYHENNRPDRNQYVVIDLARTRPLMSHHFKIHPNMDTFGYDYDYESISHVGPYDFSSDLIHPVTKPTHELDPNVVMGQRIKFSPIDVLKIQKAYNCTSDISYVVTHSPKYLVNCHFGKDLCNLKPGSGSQFDWVVKNDSGVNGPYAGHSTGIDSYLVATDDENNKGKVARLVSPISDGGPLCLDFYLFQKGPTSYLEIKTSGEGLPILPLRSFSADRYDYWQRITVGVDYPASDRPRIILEAHVDSGVVAVDDFRVVHGKCE